MKMTESKATVLIAFIMAIAFVIIVVFSSLQSYKSGYYEGMYGVELEKIAAHNDGYWDGFRNGAAEYKDIDTVVIISGFTFDKPVRIPEQQRLEISHCVFYSDTCSETMFYSGDTNYTNYYIAEGDCVSIYDYYGDPIK